MYSEWRVHSPQCASVQNCCPTKAASARLGLFYQQAGTAQQGKAEELCWQGLDRPEIQVCQYGVLSPIPRLRLLLQPYSRNNAVSKALNI